MAKVEAQFEAFRHCLMLSYQESEKDELPVSALQDRKNAQYHDKWRIIAYSIASLGVFALE